MPGDLNLKKSWHPALAKNRLKVKAAEDEELRGRQQARDKRAEIAKVRELEELKALQSGVPARVSWMYGQGAGAGAGAGASASTSAGSSTAGSSPRTASGTASGTDPAFKGIKLKKKKPGNATAKAKLPKPEPKTHPKARKDDPMSLVKR